MKNMAVVVCLAMCLGAQGQNEINVKSLAEGNLLFCVAENGNNITDVTTGLDGKQIDHVAIFHKDKGAAFALEAIHQGVCLTPIDSFYGKATDCGGGATQRYYWCGTLGGTGYAVYRYTIRFQFYAVR